MTTVWVYNGWAVVSCVRWLGHSVPKQGQWQLYRDAIEEYPRRADAGPEAGDDQRAFENAAGIVDAVEFGEEEENSGEARGDR